jgi:methylmalonyl-CoA mutase
MAGNTAWLEAAKRELKQSDPLSHLQKLWGEWKIKPYYDAEDRQHARVIHKTLISNKSANGWLNLPRVSTRQSGFNTLAINHLNSGADGVFFQLGTVSTPEVVLADIKPEHCFVGFEADSNSLSFFEEATALLQPAQKMNGCIFWKSKPDWLKVARLFQEHNSFRCFGIDVETLDAEHIERAMQNAMMALDELTDNTFAAPRVLPRFAFSVTGTSNFFLDVAMIRSLKILFDRLCQAYGVTNTPVFVRYVTPQSALPAYEPQGVMISNSLSALCAVSASVDALTVNDENQNSEVHIHTMRCISLLLQEEAKLDKVIDPTAGAYFIESMTCSIVDKIWSKLATV